MKLFRNLRTLQLFNKELWFLQIEFKRQDCWIGVFWETTFFNAFDSPDVWKYFDIWVCIIPMFPIHFRKAYLRNMT